MGAGFLFWFGFVLRQGPLSVDQACLEITEILLLLPPKECCQRWCHTQLFKFLEVCGNLTCLLRLTQRHASELLALSTGGWKCTGCGQGQFLLTEDLFQSCLFD